MGAAEATPVATQWIVVIGLLLATGIVFTILALIGAAFLGTIAYYTMLIGTVGTMLLLSNEVVSDLLDQLGPGKSLWWLTGPIATVGVFLPVYKAFRRHVLEDPVGWWESTRYYWPAAFLIICLPLVLYGTYQSAVETVAVNGVEYCTNCNFGVFRWLLMFITSVVITAVILGVIFIFFHGGVTALLGSVALLLHNIANGHPIDPMMFFDTLVGVIDEFFSVHLPSLAALVWSLVSAAYSVFQQIRE